MYAFSSMTSLGAGASWIALTLSCIGCTPSTSILCPSYVTDGTIIEYFSFFSLRPAFSSLESISLKFFNWETSSTNYQDVM